MNALKVKLNYEMNCLSEGLESKEQVLENIQNFIESEYMSKSTLKNVLEQLASIPRMIKDWLNGLTVEETMELYNENGISFVCSNGKVEYTRIEIYDMDIKDEQTDIKRLCS